MAALTVVGGIAAGLIGTTYSYGNNSILLSALTLDNNYQIAVRFVILLVCVVVVIFNIFMYIKNNMGEVKISSASTKKPEVTHEEVIVEEVVEEKPKKAPAKTSSKSGKKTTKSSKSTKSTKSSSTRKNSNKAALREEDIIVVKESVIGGSDDDEGLVPTRVEVTHRVWPFVLGFILLFVLLVMAWITWGENGFGIKFFDNVTKSFTEFELFGFPIFSKLYGAVNPFGSWSVIDLFFPVALLLFLFIIIYKVKLDDVIDGAITGAKVALVPAFISLVLYTILVSVTYHPYQLSIFKAVLGLTKGFNVLTTTVVALLASIFNVDSAYVYQSLLPYLVSVVTNTENYPLVGIISQAMYGFSTTFAPTSLVLMATLAYLNVSYKEWLKKSWKLLLELFVILLIVFIILALI